MTRTSALIRFGVVVLTAMFLLGWWMYGNDFRGDTQAHRIQLDVDQVRGASKDDVTEVRLHPVLRGYQLVLLPRLSVGTQVTIYASVAEFGFRRLGGGWIFRGEPFLGRHAVPASGFAHSQPDHAACRSPRHEPYLAQCAQARFSIQTDRK